MKKQSRWVAPILRQKHLTCFYIHTNEVSGEQVDVGQAVNYRNNPNPIPRKAGSEFKKKNVHNNY
jgi:hypothetical protein